MIIMAERELFGQDLNWTIPWLDVTLWDVLRFLVVLIIGIIIVRIASYIIKRSMLKAKVSEILADFVARVIRLILYVFVVGTALAFLNISMGAALVSVSVVLGFVLGFALGDSLSNIAAGFMIAITKPFAVGDFVTVSGESGVIKSVGISICELDTPDNKRIIIPNKSVWGGNIINFTRHGQRRIDMEVGVSYEADLTKVIEVITNICGADKRVLKDPALQVAVKEMGDSAVVLVVRPWVKTADYWDVFFDMQKNLKVGIERAGISIPFPQMDVHLDK